MIMNILMLIILFALELAYAKSNFNIFGKLRLLILEKSDLKTVLKGCYMNLIVTFVSSLLIPLLLHVFPLIHLQDTYTFTKVITYFIIINIFINVLLICFTMVAILFCYRYSSDMAAFFKYLFNLILLWVFIAIIPSLPLVLL